MKSMLMREIFSIVRSKLYIFPEFEYLIRRSDFDTHEFIQDGIYGEDKYGDVSIKSGEQ